MNIYLIDPKTDIFQRFQTVDQLFGFANRCTRNFFGRTLIVRNGRIARVIDLRSETPKELYDLAVELMNEIR